MPVDCVDNTKHALLIWNI